MTKILVVEDHPDNRDMLIRRLKFRGFETIAAADAEEAIRLARDERPDVILMDMSLPGMDGWEATQCLKKGEATSGIPVIAITAHALSRDRERALDAGCSAFQTKPVDIESLAAAIRHLLGKRDGL